MQQVAARLQAVWREAGRFSANFNLGDSDVSFSASWLFSGVSQYKLQLDGLLLVLKYEMISLESFQATLFTQVAGSTK